MRSKCLQNGGFLSAGMGLGGCVGGCVCVCVCVCVWGGGGGVLKSVEP